MKIKFNINSKYREKSNDSQIKEKKLEIVLDNENESRNRHLSF